MNNKPVAWFEQDPDMKSVWYQSDKDNPNAIPLYTHPVSKAKDRFPNYESICLQCGTTIYKPVKEITDEEWNKAFDFYCETDEGVLKFDFELRDEWKKEQLIRWKEALRKAQEK